MPLSTSARLYGIAIDPRPGPLPHPRRPGSFAVETNPFWGRGVDGYLWPGDMSARSNIGPFSTRVSPPSGILGP